MKISRWIRFPLILGLSLGICFGILDYSLGSFFYGLTFGVIGGLILQFYSDYKTKRISPNATEEEFDISQQKKFVLFYDYHQAFDLCLESIKLLRKGKLKWQNRLDGTIRAKTGVNWETFGNKINFKLTKLTEETTEVEVSTTPIPWTAQVDYGDGLRIVKTLKEFFQTENDKKNLRILEKKPESSINTVFANNVKIKSDYKQR